MQCLGYLTRLNEWIKTAENGQGWESEKKTDQYFHVVVLTLNLSIAPKSVTIKSEGYCIRQSSDELVMT